MHIIYVDGCFDLFHPGYISFFERILEEFDQDQDIKLIIGLMTDQQMTEYRCPPIFNLKERKTMLESCIYIDTIIENPPIPITKEFIDKNNINMVIHGSDMPNNKLDFWYKDAILLNKFKVIPYTYEITTLSIINRIMNRAFS